MNKVIIIGRFTRDPEVNTTASGIKYARFTIAVDRGFGENKTTDFIPMVAWRQSADFIGNYLTKGSLVSIDGTFTSSTYEKDGKNVTKYEVQVNDIKSLESKRNSESAPQATQNTQPATTSNKVENTNWDFDL